ncbi:hypothetical protein ACFPM0_19305 [Pseudonocardia sulfidoxydans]|uniref:hypothetical protein n=1 Tax=Pseudonocardia sulfidoxydans TaxID=54011 RepID=UPI00361D4B25
MRLRAEGRPQPECRAAPPGERWGCARRTGRNLSVVIRGVGDGEVARGAVRSSG